VSVLIICTPEETKEALTPMCPKAPFHCDPDVKSVEQVYDAMHEALLFGTLTLAGCEVVAGVVACWYSTVDAHVDEVCVSIHKEYMMQDDIEDIPEVVPQIRYAIVAHMIRGEHHDRLQLTASTALRDEDDASSSWRGILTDVQRTHMGKIKDAANACVQQCLDKGAHDEFKPLCQKMQVFSTDKLNDPKCEGDGFGHSLYPRQFLVGWVDLSEPPPEMKTVGGLSASARGIRSEECKAVACVVVFDKDYRRSDAVRFLYAALHDRMMCENLSANVNQEKREKRNKALRALGKSYNVAAIRVPGSPCDREVMNLIASVNKEPRLPLASMVPKTLAQDLAVMESAAARQDAAQLQKQMTSVDDGAQPWYRWWSQA
jgi:hypothetical protein